MRYINVPTGVYRDAAGNAFVVHDIRIPESRPVAFKVKVSEGFALDEVASRPDVLGSEALTWQLFDANRVVLTERDFDSSKLREVAVPR